MGAAFCQNNARSGQPSRLGVVLHYLSGKIDLDVYFPLDPEIEPARAERLRQEMSDSLGNHPEFGRLQLYFRG